MLSESLRNVNLLFRKHFLQSIEAGTGRTALLMILIVGEVLCLCEVTLIARIVGSWPIHLDDESMDLLDIGRILYLGLGMEVTDRRCW